MYNISIDSSICTQCGRCAMVCSSHTLEQETVGGTVTVSKPFMCIACGHCVDVCPTGAFKHSEFPLDKIRKVNTDILPSPESLMELIRSRRSNRTMTSERLKQSDIDIIMEAARYAPTAENRRNVSLQIITDTQTLQGIEDGVMDHFMKLTRLLRPRPINALIKRFMPKLHCQITELELMNEKRKQGLRPATVNATAILLITAPKDSRFGYQDCNLAYQNASLMAQSLGISQVYLGFAQTAFGMWGTKKTAQFLGLEKNQKVFAIMALGKPRLTYQNYTVR